MDTETIVLLINLGTIVGMLFSISKLSFALGKVYKELTSAAQDTEVRIESDLKEIKYNFTQQLDRIAKRLDNLESNNAHRDEITILKQESINSTIVSDIANICANIDDIEMYLMKHGYHRYNAKLIHGKKRKLTQRDLSSYNTDTSYSNND